VGTYKLGELSGNGALGAYYLSETTTWEVGALGTDSTFDGVIVNAISPNLGLAALKKVGAGKLTVTAASTYGGGTTVAGGILEVGAAGSLGTGTVEVVEGTLSLLGSAAIADAAQLRVAGGADKLHLAAGVDETVGEFFIDGVAKPWGKWGRIGNALAPRQTAAIAGDGILTVLIGAEPPGTVLIIR
jgi:autotransporter-associated beta strand protein